MSQEARQHVFEFFNASRFQEAKTLCHKLLKANDTDPELWSVLAAIHGQLGEFDMAANAARKALALFPNYPGAHFNLGLALMRLSRPHQAMQSFQQAVRLQPGHANALICLGKLYDSEGKPYEAISHYQKALEVENANVDVMCNLAFLYERTHQLDRAEEVVGAALREQPFRFDANLVAARLDRRKGCLDSAQARLEKMLSGEMPRDSVAEVNYELALVLDLKGDYEQAFTTFGRCQKLAAEAYTGRYSGAGFFDRIRRNRQAITEKAVEGWHKTAQDDGIPDPVFVVGFPRSGTTLTEQILSSHSRVVPSDEAELIPATSAQIQKMHGDGCDYPNGLAALDADQVRTLRGWYWQKARGVAGRMQVNDRFLDKLPLNIIEIGLIHRLFPEAPIVFCMRDPRDVCLSCYTQYFAPNDSMANFLEIGSTVRFYAAVMDLWEHYKQVFDLNVLELRYEDLVTDTEATIRKLVAFAGLEWEDAVLDYDSGRRMRQVSTPSYQGIATPIYTRSAGRWRHYSRQIGNAFDELRRFVEAYGYAGQ